MNGLAYFKFDNTGNKRRVSYFVEDKKVRSYIFDNKEYYTHPLLNWENLSYSYSFGEEEPDEYLMYHALQDCKKICVSISSSNPGVINDVIENFSNVYECDVYQYRSDPKKCRVTVAKEGTLRDYYDIEAVMDVYDENGITYNDAIVGMMADVPLIFLLTRKYTDYDNRVYDPYFDMEDDANDVLKTYKAAGMIIAGLLFGYPLEATISEIHKFEHLWF